MQHTTRGIVLHHIKYSDSSIIAYIYTELFGRQTYVVKGVHGKKSKTRANYFNPLFLVELEVTHQAKRTIQTLSEVRLSEPLISIPYDIAKSSLALFIAEILYKSIREEAQNFSLFQFLHQSVHLLDRETKNLAHFHLAFLMQLTRHIGFYPNNNYAPHKPYFDMLEGTFTDRLPLHRHTIVPPYSAIFAGLIDASMTSQDDINILKKDRNVVLEKIIEFYQIHVPSLREVNSYTVLKDVLES